MAARLRLLRAEGRPEAVYFSKRQRVGFVIKLPGLGKKHLLLIEVVDLEKGCRAFARGGREYRGIDQRETMRIEIVADGPDHFMPNTNNGMLPPAAQPEMAMIHQEIGAMLFRGNGIRVRLRHALDDLGSFEVHFI